MTIFRKQILLTAVVMMIFILLGIFASTAAIQFEFEKAPRSPMVVLAKIIDHTAETEGLSRQEAASRLQNSIGDKNMQLRILRPSEIPKQFNLLPKTPYAAVLPEASQGSSPFPHFGPPTQELIKLSSNDFLWIENLRNEDEGGPRPLRIFLINSAVMLLSVFMASTVSVLFLFFAIRARAKLADQILSEMRDGNLKARFPIARSDEIGQLMLKFNQMAAEIENLVNRVKASELARMRLLQELAHDLRTPLASLKNLNEILQSKSEVLAPEHREQLLSLSLKEIEYFARLVEDLLFLAQVTDPKYQAVRASVDLLELAQGTIEGIIHAQKVSGKLKQFIIHCKESSVAVKGDRYLLQRLLRNALENAGSFAHSQVDIYFDRVPQGIQMRIEDDGPGMSESALHEFGDKRSSRILGPDQNGRLSVGLGSVIMKAIAHAHDAELFPSNRVGDDNLRVKGARLRIDFKF